MNLLKMSVVGIRVQTWHGSLFLGKQSNSIRYSRFEEISTNEIVDRKSRSSIIISGASIEPFVLSGSPGPDTPDKYIRT